MITISILRLRTRGDCLSKQVLKDIISTINQNAYNWSLYFFRIDRRAHQPYKMYKVRFKKDDYLTSYASSLLSAISKFQIEPLSRVQEYDGENTKITCDKINLSDELISEAWNNLNQAVAVASDKKIKEKLNGYILVGQPDDEELKTVTFVKVANPIIKFETKKSVVFKNPTDNELDAISDDMYRLYLTTDFMVLSDVMYTFNHSFEKLFNLEKTMSRVKCNAIKQIVSLDIFSESSEFQSYADSYNSSRTFITLNSDRMNRIQNKELRKQTAIKLGIATDDNGKLIIDNAKKAEDLIKYLCYKIFVDGETDEMLEASTVTKFTTQNN